MLEFVGGLAFVAKFAVKEIHLKWSDKDRAKAVYMYVLVEIHQVRLGFFSRESRAKFEHLIVKAIIWMDWVGS